MNRKELLQNFMKGMDSMSRVAFQNKHISTDKNKPSRAQMGIIFVIAHRGPQTIKDLASQFGMTSSAATQLVNGLVKNGYLTRNEDPNDRRKICVALAQKAHKVIEKAKQQRIEWMTKLFEPLTDEEVEQLLKIQAKISEHWETTCKNKNNK